MPCYEVRMISVKFKIGNASLLEQALKSLGLMHTVFPNRKLITTEGISLDLESGKAIVLDGYQDRLNQIKQAYSREAVKVAAKKFAWATKTQGSNITVNKVRW